MAKIITPGTDTETQQAHALRSVCLTCWREMGFLAARTFESYFTMKIPRLGASVAFYTVLSLAPLLVVVVGIAGMIFSREAAERELLHQMQTLLGLQGAEIVRLLLQSAQSSGSGILPTLFGLGALFFGSTVAVSELRDGVNYIWGVPEDQGTGLSVVKGMIRDRTRSFLLVLSVGFLLLVSLAMNAGISAAGTYFGNLLPLSELPLQLINFVISFLIITFLFALLYRFLPDLRIEWEDVLIGSAITALLFSVGKTLIGIYLGKAGLASTYGAAGSLAVLLVWVYYSAQIFYLGAMFTKTYAENFGSQPTRRFQKKLKIVSRLKDEDTADTLVNEQAPETAVVVAAESEELPPAEQPKVEIVQSLGGDVITNARAANLDVPR
jgi:membrane protein